MTRWTGIVVASTAGTGDEMASSLPSYLHPIAGRPLIWHTVAGIVRSDPAPGKVVVVGGAEVAVDLFSDLTAVPVSVVRPEQLGDFDWTTVGDSTTAMVVVDAAASLRPDTLSLLVSKARGAWLGSDGDSVAAARLDLQLTPEVLRVATPLRPGRGILTANSRLPDSSGAVVVRSRVDLSEVSERVRARIVAGHMRMGVTFLLPSSVLVDVDVRIGADTVIYPGVVLEGETTVGAETVIGPGCRIIDSWIGSGVELKGWNYIAHTSVRNRAILEPYVRRGFD